MKLIIITILFNICRSFESISVDICVYGGTSAGVMAVYKAKKLGKSVVLVEPGRHLGGITSGGLGFTDYGDKNAIAGLAKDFYLRIGRHYGSKSEKFTFEPHIAEDVFDSYISEANITVLFDKRIISANKIQNRVDSIVTEDSAKPETSTNLVIKAKIFIDCSYEGDLMARTGIPYTIGSLELCFAKC